MFKNKLKPGGEREIKNCAIFNSRRGIRYGLEKNINY